MSDDYFYYIDSNINSQYDELKENIMTFCSQNNKTEYNLLILLSTKIIKNYFNVNMKSVLDEIRVNFDNIKEENFEETKITLIDKITLLETKFKVMKNNFQQAIFNNDDIILKDINDISKIKRKINDYDIKTPVNFKSVSSVLKFLKEETKKLVVSAEEESNWYEGKKVNNVSSWFSYYIKGIFAYAANRCSYKHKVKCYKSFLNKGVIPLQTYITTKTNDFDTCNDILNGLSSSIKNTLTKIRGYTLVNYNPNIIQSFIQNFETRMATVAETLKIQI
jgi:hypothetical protein